jgi:uncharacterized membrane protein YgdD (TMEM256/DUF423 family)
MSPRWIAALAALNGLMAVTLGALATHGVADPHAKDLFHTASIYQLTHAVAALAVLGRSRWSAALMSVGALLFSGSIYLLAWAGLPQGAPLAGAVGLLGPVTPVGGLMMIAGWFVLMVTAFRRRDASASERP